MSLIDRFMPLHALRQVDRVAVDADPDRAYALVRGADFHRLPLVRALFGLRTLPEGLAARVRGRPSPAARSARIDDIVRDGTGFVLLGEDPGREVVIGSVGKFWQPRIDFAKVTPAEFPSFAGAGFGKLAWSLRVDPREGGGSFIGLDLRVGASDAAALAAFRRYWWIVGRFSHAIRKEVLRFFERELGAPLADHARMLPGDDFLVEAAFQRTHTVDIEAPPGEIWPWLAQMGGGRAGWYSIDRLDNGGRPSADHLVPELQRLGVGDLIHATPDGSGGDFAVLRAERPRTLVLGSPSLLLPGGDGDGRVTRDRMTWAFALEPIGDSAARLVVRVRADRESSLKAAVLSLLIGGAHEIMERRQLANLKRRVETPPAAA